MRKKIAYFFLFLVIALAIAYFFRYKQSLSYTNKVPASAKAVLHLNLRQLEHKVLMDALQNPLAYIDLKSSKKEDDKKKDLLDGISIPKNLFLYATNGSIISNKIDIKDKEDLDTFLKQEQFKKTQLGAISIYKKGLLHIATQNEFLVFAYSNKNMNTLLKDTFLNTNFLDEDDALLKQLKSNDSDGVLASKEGDFIVFNIKNGEATIEGTLKEFSDLFLPITTENYNDSLVAYTSGKIAIRSVKPLISKRQKEKFNKLTSLSLDSIITKWNGEFNFNINAIQSKIDTIITYEYDDDFNKIEKKSTQKVINPNLDFQLKGKTLYTYFVNEKAIKLVEVDSLFTTIPIGKLYANHTEDVFLVSSSKAPKTFEKNNTNKFQLFLNIEKYLANQLDFYTIKQGNETDLLQNASLIITKSDSIKASVKLKNKSRNFIGQFFTN